MTPAGGDLPRLAVFHSDTAAPVFELIEASQGLCRLLWIVGWSSDEPPLRLLARFGEVVDLRGLSRTDAIDRVVATAPDGVAVFNDPPLSLAAEVAQCLGLPFHTPLTARLLGDKVAQREALRDAGVAVPRFAAVDPLSPVTDVPFPAVLKPRAGAGSRDTFLVEGDDDVAHAMSLCAPGQGFIVEELLRDRSPHGTPFADIVSVESIVRGDEIEHVTVTGRLPFAPPFRESGSFLPSNLSSIDWDLVTTLAGEAARALSVTTGVLHTEIKLTPEGPRLIEVNGRLGGVVSALLSRVGGPSLTKCAMQLALGLDVETLRRADPARVAYFRLVVAPPLATGVIAIDGLATLAELEGVDAVETRLQPGDAVDVQSGYTGYAVKIDGVVSSHAELFSLMEEIDATVAITWNVTRPSS